MDFQSTLHNNLDPDQVAWVCSFAIWQHGDIAGALNSLETCPFAVAMMHADRVMVVTDTTAEALSRCWVVLEATFAHKWRKPYDICLPDDEDADMWHDVGLKLEALDVRNCKASVEADKIAILEYAQQHAGGIEALNEEVRRVSGAAALRAELMSAARAGDTARLAAADVETLTTWRSIRGRTLCHVTARHSRVEAMVRILEQTGSVHLNLRDRDGRTPLSVAVEYDSIASIEALVVLGANLETPSHSALTPLHYAAAAGHLPIAELLMDAGAKVSAQGTYRGAAGHRPITVAAREGHAHLISTLVKNRADVEARVSGFSALHLAAKHRHAEAAAALVAAMAAVDGRESGGFERTALMFAVQRCSVSVVGLLLGAKASTCAEDGRGYSCYCFCSDAVVRTFLDLNSPPAAKRTRAATTATILQAFRRVDVQSSGVIAKDMLVATFQRVLNLESIRMSEHQLDALFSAAGAHGAGAVDYVAVIDYIFGNWDASSGKASTWMRWASFSRRLINVDVG